MKKYSVLIIALVVISLLTGCVGIPRTKATNPPERIVTDAPTEEPTEDPTAEPTEEPGPRNDFGKTISFDGFEITVNEGYSFTKVNNQFSELNGKDVIELPVHIKNTGSETDHLNSFYYSFFGSKGTELDNVSAYFDNDIFRAGDLRPGAEYDTYFHLLYDGDGQYFIEFDNYATKTELELSISK